MSKRVKVTLSGSQRTKDGAADKTVTGGPGSWSCDGKTHRVSFREGESGVFCDAYLTERELRFTRRGAVSSEMVFRPGERTVCLYTAQEGAFELEIETIKIGLHASPRGVDAFARYRIVFEKGGYQENTIMLRTEPGT